MKYEKSCGAIIFRGDLFLLLKYPGGYWGSAKGHVEDGEDEKETARREVLEETGLSDIEFIPGFREKVQYTYKARGVQRNKTVIFFLAKTGQGFVEISREHKDFEWLPFEEALERTTYEDEKEILRKAKKRLQSHDIRLNEYF